MTLFGKEQMSVHLKFKGTNTVVKDLLKFRAEVGEHAIDTALVTLGRKPLESAALSDFRSFSFASTSSSLQ